MLNQSKHAQKQTRLIPKSKHCPIRVLKQSDQTVKDYFKISFRCSRARPHFSLVHQNKGADQTESFSKGFDCNEGSKREVG